ncbi:MAG: hypothetical protein ABGX16_19360 [Pirellulales bacterium]
MLSTVATGTSSPQVRCSDTLGGVGGSGFCEVSWGKHSQWQFEPHWQVPVELQHDEAGTCCRE